VVLWTALSDLEIRRLVLRYLNTQPKYQKSAMMLSALLLGDQTEVGIIRIGQESGELSCPTDTSRKSKDPQNISDPDCPYLNVQHRYRKSATTSFVPFRADQNDICFIRIR
jgi:hypothetical protein